LNKTYKAAYRECLYKLYERSRDITRSANELLFSFSCKIIAIFAVRRCGPTQFNLIASRKGKIALSTTRKAVRVIFKLSVKG
jgi:hypothetical protein